MAFLLSASFDVDELEDYLELRDAAVQEQIAASNRDVGAGRTRSAVALLSEFKKTKVTAKNKRATKR